MIDAPFPARIHVVGTCGSGKTTLARQLAQALNYRHVELDALNWEPGWREASDQVFLERVRDATGEAGWVADGNYARGRPILWAQRPTVIWLDYSFPLVMTRVVSRTAHRVLRQEELWNGNRESLRKAFSSDSIVWWALTTYHRRRREYPAQFARHPELPVIQIRDPAQAEQLLASARGGQARPALDVAAHPG